MTREYSEHASPEVQGQLQRLVDRVPSREYRDAMGALGQALGRVVAGQLDPTASVLLICTNEDADFLARGTLDALKAGGFDRVALACFWNDRRTVRSEVGPDLDTAPIVRRYVEPVETVDAFVVVKSVISSACVVRTNTTELVYEKRPARIFVAAPVMYKGARIGLEAECPAEIVALFEYVWFAVDDEKKDDGEVVPGIGGSVYELLGIGDKETKNQYTPEIVRQRRQTLYAEA
jgi:hypothetical protein